MTSSIQASLREFRIEKGLATTASQKRPSTRLSQRRTSTVSPRRRESTAPPLRKHLTSSPQLWQLAAQRQHPRQNQAASRAEPQAASVWGISLIFKMPLQILDRLNTRVVDRGGEFANQPSAFERRFGEPRQDRRPFCEHYRCLEVVFRILYTSSSEIIWASSVTSDLWRSTAPVRVRCGDGGGRDKVPMRGSFQLSYGFSSKEGRF